MESTTVSDKTPEVKVVDAEKAELKVQYCIPVWLRDQQVKMNSERFPNRIDPVIITRSDPIALVCYGPSLNETWEKIKGFKHVMTCSGSHKFLRERGITPTWHVDVDPREHKKELIGNDISSETEFLMASCCHPQVFDHLVAHNAKITLWHTYSGESKEDIPLCFPRGEWMLTGGANVGLRALTICRFLGFTDIHIFGMDGSFEPGKLHAADHPNQAKKHIFAEYGGKQYATTTSFLECARMTFHELAMLPDVNVTFYGDGLIQTMAKDKVPEIQKKKKVNIAFLQRKTISPEYTEQNKLLHQSNAAYGISSLRHLQAIKNLYEKLECTSILDYGCGKGLLAKNLPFPIWEYDPAIPGKDSPPRAADLLVCIDVLEHVEPEYLESTLLDIARCTKKICYLTISLVRSSKELPDGRNTHILVKDKDWWLGELSKYFVINEKGVFDKGNEIYVVTAPRPKQAGCDLYYRTA